jgi:hypothetical protein
MREGLKLLLANPEKHVHYAVDKYWFQLQRADRWFLLVPLTVTQLPGYSDIELRETDYDRVMLDLDKPWLRHRHDQRRNDQRRVSTTTLQKNKK